MRQVTSETPAQMLKSLTEATQIDAKTLRYYIYYSYDNLVVLIMRLGFARHVWTRWWRHFNWQRWISTLRLVSFATSLPCWEHTMMDLSSLWSLMTNEIQLCTTLSCSSGTELIYSHICNFMLITWCSCLDASLAWKPVITKYGRVVITSGTLSPLDMLPRILGYQASLTARLPISLIRYVAYITTSYNNWHVYSDLVSVPWSWHEAVIKLFCLQSLSREITLTLFVTTVNCSYSKRF